MLSLRYSPLPGENQGISGNESIFAPIYPNTDRIGGNC